MGTGLLQAAREATAVGSPLGCRRLPPATRHAWARNK